MSSYERSCKRKKPEYDLLDSVSYTLAESSGFQETFVSELRKIRGIFDMYDVPNELDGDEATNAYCKQLFEKVKAYKETFYASEVLHKLWPISTNPDAQSGSYLYIFLDSTLINKPFAQWTLKDFILAAYYIGESTNNVKYPTYHARMTHHYSMYNSKIDNKGVKSKKQIRIKKISDAKSKKIVVKVNVASKELAENLEYILAEFFGDQVTNVDHGKASFEDVYMLSPANAQLIGQLIMERIFAEKEEVSVEF